MIIRLQRLGGCLVPDDAFDPLAGSCHLQHFGTLERGWIDCLARLIRRGQHMLGDIRPAVVDQVKFPVAAGHDRREIGHTLALPAVLERTSPLGIRGAIGAHVDRCRRALEYIEMPGGLRQVGNRLNGGRAGSDDADSLVRQPRHSAPFIAARVPVVPTAGVKGVSAEALDARNAGQTRSLNEAARADDEARRDSVVAVGRRDPARALLVPLQIGDDRLKKRAWIEIVALRELPAVGQDLGRPCIFLTRDIAHFLQHRHVNVGFDITCGTRIAVPVPRATEVGALLDHPDIIDPLLP